MAINDKIRQNTTFSQSFMQYVGETTFILNAMSYAYEGSSIARKLIDDWIDSGRLITIGFEPGVLGAYAGMGVVFFDPRELIGAMYIDNNGNAVQDTLVTALVHELVHALTGALDDGVGTPDYRGDETDYKGTNVIEANKIFNSSLSPALCAGE